MSHHPVATEARVKICEAALANPAQHESEAHYRLYLTSAGMPVTVCVQSFDYVDYDAERFLTTEAYLDETHADAALSQLLSEALAGSGRSPGGHHASVALFEMGAPMTRAQAVEAWVVRNTPTGVRQFPIGVTLAGQMRVHAFEQGNREVAAKLMQMADRLDGGTGNSVHHGCPDSSIPTADCAECAMVLDSEVNGGSAVPSIFR